MRNKPSTESITLSELFKKELVVPEYQRPYIWTTDQLNKLISQIEKHQARQDKDKPLFYLGSIVLHVDGNNFNIIDGQQRIASLALIAFIINNDKSSSNDFRIKISFDNLISQQTIRRNYEYLLSQYGRLGKIDFDNINVTVVSTENQDQAYSFFETLNTGGIRLNGSQILKAHHLRSISDYDISDYGLRWEREEQYIEDVIRLLLKARKWNVFENEKLLLSRRMSESEWKNVMTKEFSEKTVDLDDCAFSQWIKKGRKMEELGNEYAVRQPISNGKNFINYLLSYVSIYKQLFAPILNTRHSIKYQKFTEDIIDNVDGTIDLKQLYQLALLCYASKFGINSVEHSYFWIFRFVYSLRVGNKLRVTEKGVFNHNNDHFLIDRILTAFSEDEVLSWLKSYTYEVDPNLYEKEGVKKRFALRIVAKLISLEEYDKCLIQKYSE